MKSKMMYFVNQCSLCVSVSMYVSVDVMVTVIILYLSLQTQFIVLSFSYYCGCTQCIIIIGVLIMIASGYAIGKVKGQNY